MLMQIVKEFRDRNCLSSKSLSDFEVKEFISKLYLDYQDDYIAVLSSHPQLEENIGKLHISRGNTHDLISSLDEHFKDTLIDQLELLEEELDDIGDSRADEIDYINNNIG